MHLFQTLFALYLLALPLCLARPSGAGEDETSDVQIDGDANETPKVDERDEEPNEPQSSENDDEASGQDEAESGEQKEEEPKEGNEDEEAAVAAAAAPSAEEKQSEKEESDPEQSDKGSENSEETETNVEDQKDSDNTNPMPVEDSKDEITQPETEPEKEPVADEKPAGDVFDTSVMPEKQSPVNDQVPQESDKSVENDSIVTKNVEPTVLADQTLDVNTNQTGTGNETQGESEPVKEVALTLTDLKDNQTVASVKHVKSEENKPVEQKDKEEKVEDEVHSTTPSTTQVLDSAVVSLSDKADQIMEPSEKEFELPPINFTAGGDWINSSNWQFVSHDYERSSDHDELTEDDDYHHIMDACHVLGQKVHEVLGVNKTDKEIHEAIQLIPSFHKTDDYDVDMYTKTVSEPHEFTLTDSRIQVSRAGFLSRFWLIPLHLPDTK
ncbi:unnamed protein product [Echinostoma caproni]|uniref:Dentin sialophosphoprotein-like n=1 Tax=Echinostoma caproni TaxID=27848 RepID=A0A183A5X1_9TREM|nr:unnamed protein product [Echinostoma caproni]